MRTAAVVVGCRPALWNRSGQLLRLSRMRAYARWLCLVALMGLAVGCGSQRPGTSSPVASIAGTVSAGPISPVSRVGHRNTRPVQGASVEALRGSQVVATDRTDGAGHYELTLQPGTYTVQAAADGFPFAKRQPRVVTVSAGQRETVNFQFDTGIR